MAGKIIVDGVFFQSSLLSGIARLWREILAQWSQSDLRERIVLLNRGQLPEELSGLAVLDFPAFDVKRWQADPPRVQQLCDQLGADLFISTYYTYPVSTRSLLWVHDMTPERMGFDLAEPVWRQKHAAIRHAAGYACSSTHTLNDLHALFPDTRQKPAVVAGAGVASSMRPATALERQNFFANFVGPKLKGTKYIFMPGATNHYKNGVLLAEALSRMDCSGLGLLITTHSDDFKRFKSIPNLVVYGETLNENDMRLAYDGAHCMVYPSFYEGFGMPVLEAMACGCPVICSNTSSLPGVAGDAAILIDPHRAETLVEALRLVSRQDVRDTLIERGRKRARTFTWYSVVAELEVLVDELLGGALHSAQP